MVTNEFTAQVTGFKMLTPTVFQLDFKTKEPRFDFEGGQFVSVLIPGGGPKGRDIRRAYSIASEPDNPTIQLCIKIVEGGPGTTFLKQFRPGQEFKIFGPYGSFIHRFNEHKNSCFIATGTGISPFRSMIRSRKFKLNAPKKTWCLLGVRCEDEVLYHNEFESIQDQINWIPAVSQPQKNWAGFNGRVTDILRGMDSAFPWKETDYYLCGAGAMITEVKEILALNGVEKSSIHQEIYYKG